MPSSAVAVRPRVLALLVPGVVLLALGVALGVWVLLRGDGPFVVDAWWNEVIAATASPLLSGFSLAMNFLGGGWFGVFVVPIAGTILLLVARRPWSAAFFLTAQMVSALVVQVLKQTVGRARPEDILVLSDYGSYPSGHVAGAATLAAAAAVLFPRVLVIGVGAVWVVLMAFSRTYLHAHWLSDTLGGALIGVGAALVAASAFTPLLLREQPRAWP